MGKVKVNPAWDIREFRGSSGGGAPVNNALRDAGVIVADPGKSSEEEGVKIGGNTSSPSSSATSTKPTYSSKYQSQLDDVLSKIMNREKFSYDLNADALYQQYKDKFIHQGKLASQDAIGRAAAMTGGFGNSWAQSVGQQQFNAQLENLNDVIPELYQLAYDKHNQEGQDLINQFAMLGDLEDRDYSRYRNEVGDWKDERDFLYTKEMNDKAYAPQQQQALIDALRDGGYIDDKGKIVPVSSTNSIPQSVIDRAKGFTTKQAQADYLASEVNKKTINNEQALEILSQYGITDFVDRTWEKVDDGGINWFGIGIDADAKVSDGNKTYTLAELRKELEKTMSRDEANKWIKDLEKKLKI